MSDDVLLFLMQDFNMGQRERVVVWMQERGSITSKEASEHLAIQDLPKRISELVNDYGYGELIQKEDVDEKNRFGQSSRFKRYSMEIQHGWVC